MAGIESLPLEHIDFAKRYGPWAVVAGASEGLGACYAEQLARMGVNLVLVSRRFGVLEALGVRLSREFGIQCRPVEINLATPDAAARLLEATADLDVGLYVSNAGLDGTGNNFLDAPLDRAAKLVAMNVNTLIATLHGFGNRFKARGSGGFVVMSSIGALIGSPWLATYAATKAFGLTIAESLWGEFRGVGVDIIGVCAPTMDTPTFRRAFEGLATGIPDAQDPAEIAAVALAKLGKSPIVIFPESNDRENAREVEADRVRRLVEKVEWADANLTGANA